MEIGNFNKDNLPEIDPGKMHTAAVAIETGKSLAGIVLMLFIFLKFNFLRIFEKSGDEFLRYMGMGFRVILIIFFVLLVISFIENLITLILLYSGEQDTSRMALLLKISGLMRSGGGFFFVFVFGAMFGGFGGFAAFAENVEKDENAENIGIVFMLIGIGICISAVVSFIKLLIKEMNS